MGQVASRRHHFKTSDMKKKKVKKYPLEIWRQIKDVEIVQLKQKTAETEQEFERMKKRMACQSFLLKEIFQDTLKEQRENHNKEIAELRKEIAELKKEIQKKN
jgi:predicted  nucleic acid-binding Zn-ribbon protein